MRTEIHGFNQKDNTVANNLNHISNIRLEGHVVADNIERKNRIEGIRNTNLRKIL